MKDGQVLRPGKVKHLPAATEGKALRREYFTMSDVSSNGVLEPYRVDVYGNEREDFHMCLAALNDQCDKIALVHRAMDGMSQEVTDNQHSQVLMAAYDTLGTAVAVMNKALTVLADCR